MDLMNSIKVAATGMRAQGTRLRIVAENIANAQIVRRYRVMLTSWFRAGMGVGALHSRTLI